MAVLDSHNLMNTTLLKWTNYEIKIYLTAQIQTFYEDNENLVPTTKFSILTKG